MREAGATGEHALKRVLGPVNLMTLGIGAIIGAGIFVLTGSAASLYAGPAIMLSYVLAGVGCVFAGLCYAEFASLIPIAGSAYTYGYATLGEIVAWVIGWDLILEYAFGAATVASGWSSTLIAFLQDYGINLPPQICDVPGAKWVFFDGRWSPLVTLDLTADQLASLPMATAKFNLLAFLAVIAVTIILIVGIKESANFNTGIVFVKLAAVFTFIAVATAFLLKHPQIAHEHWRVFLPPNTGTFGSYGWSGVLRGAGVVFFAYIGFDAVSTAAQEAKNPQKDMPIGILGSLTICTILYILVALVLTGLVNYHYLAVPDSLAMGMDVTGVKWGSLLVKFGALGGLTSTMVVMLLGQSRVFFSMSKDGLLPRIFSKVHPKFRTPYISSITVGLVVAVFASTIPLDKLGEMTSIGTLLAFIIVCAGVLVLRSRRPDLPRPFRAPFSPTTPILGILISLAMMLGLPGETWLRLVIWLVVGLVIYFSYGKAHSRVQHGLKPLPPE